LDWYPLFNSVRIAGIASVIVFFTGIFAGLVLAFARALGEYGATSMLIGYIPGKTATISTTVYHLWRTDNESAAFNYILVNLAISACVLLAVNMLEKRGGGAMGK
jgi:molybdate transport system permease protein